MDLVPLGVGRRDADQGHDAVEMTHAPQGLVDRVDDQLPDPGLLEELPFLVNAGAPFL